MEPLNNSLTNIINFILVVQDACDKHKQDMEHLWQQEYTSYISDWKPSQTEPKLPDVITSEVKSQNVTKPVQSVQMNEDDYLDDLDLALADSLLEKARKLRTKNKVLTNGLVNCRNLPMFCNDKIVPSSAGSVSKQAPEKVKGGRKLPQSKSDFTLSNNQNSIAPIQKSVSVPFISKNCETFCESKSCSSLLSKKSAVRHTNNTNKTSKEVAVISNKDLDRFKNLQINIPTCQKSKGGKVTPSSDVSEKTRQHRKSAYPSSEEFLYLMKDKLNAISFEIKLKLW